LGLTFEEFLEEYYGYYGFGHDAIEIALNENYDYRHNYLKLHTQDEKAKEAYAKDMEYMLHGEAPDKFPT
jgi:hypothetical protein